MTKMETKEGEDDESGNIQDSFHSMIPELDLITPDGGWGWFIVFASFLMQVIGGY